MLVSAHRGVRSTLTGRKQIWSLIVDPDGRSGADNMAIDAALLRAAQQGEAFLRLYRWRPPCLSFGRNEPALMRYDRQLIEDRGLDVVRRPTGGRAVWHAQEVTYAVVAPFKDLGTLQASYREIHTMLASALRTLAVPADLAAEGIAPGGIDAGACFGAPVGGEVMVESGKVIGSAQWRDGEALLQHGSILLENDQDLVREVTRGSVPASVASSLRDVLGVTPTFAAVADAIVRVARERWGGTWHDVPVPTVDATPYRDPTWTWRR